LRSKTSGRCTLRALFVAAFAITLFGLPDRVRAQPLNVERSGTLHNVTVAKGRDAMISSARLTFDVDWLYRASVLSGAPLVNCGVRVRNLRGTVSFVADGKPVQLTVDESNRAELAVMDIGLVMQTGFMRDFTALRCPGNLVGTETAPVWGVPAAYSAAALLCVHSYNPVRLPLPDRLGPDWCTDTLGGRFLDADRATSVYSPRVGRPQFHHEAEPQVMTAAFGFAGLISAWRSREAEKKREEEAAKRTAEEEERRARLEAALGRALGDEDGAKPSDHASRLGRILGAGDDAGRSPREDPIAAALARGEAERARAEAERARTERARAREAALVRLAALEVERNKLRETRDKARAECEEGRPIFRRATGSIGGGLSLVAVPQPCRDEACRRERELQAERARQRERERKEREARAAEERRRQEERRLAEHERAVLQFEQRELPACLARAEDAFRRASTQLDDEERSARQFVARRD